jgi:hypothetical protein
MGFVAKWHWDKFLLIIRFLPSEYDFYHCSIFTHVSSEWHVRTVFNEQSFYSLSCSLLTFLGKLVKNNVLYLPSKVGHQWSLLYLLHSDFLSCPNMKYLFQITIIFIIVSKSKQRFSKLSWCAFVQQWRSVTVRARYLIRTPLGSPCLFSSAYPGDFRKSIIK